MTFFGTLLGKNFVRLPDFLDWRISLTPGLSHREAFDELFALARDARVDAKAHRRTLTSAPMALAPSWSTVEIEIEVSSFYPYFNDSGRATGDMDQRKSGPDQFLDVENVYVETSGLKESWQALILSRALSVSSALDPSQGPVESVRDAPTLRGKGKRGRKPGSGSINDESVLHQMLVLLATGQVASSFAAAGQFRDKVPRRIARKRATAARTQIQDALRGRSPVGKNLG